METLESLKALTEAVKQMNESEENMKKLFANTDASLEMAFISDNKKKFQEAKTKIEELAKKYNVSLTWHTSGGHFLNKKVSVNVKLDGKFKDNASVEKEWYRHLFAVHSKERNG